ncbi:UDP-glucose-sterol transferase [Apiospora arundinis]|uniref:UDP-glucose-sterol transferase n=1 Tax=Apiospora arundinis TaxID=335852 RepID=A0ABR2JIE6_9PEZI
MRLAKSSRTANLPEARAGGPSQARSNNQQQQQQYQQHQMTATTNVTEPVGAAQSQNQIVDDAIWRPADAVGHDQYHAQPPPSNVAATSQLDAANEMDFGVKFMGGGLDAMPGTVMRVQPTAAAATTTTGEPFQPHGPQLQPQQQHQQYMQTHDTTTPAEHSITMPTVVGHPSSNYYTAEKPRQRVEAGRQEDHDEAECHPFWLSWRDIFLGTWMIITGVLQIPLVVGDGFAKAMHHTPVLYGDKTVRKWPQLTGFPHGCVAGVQALWFGVYDGGTDWVILPYKAVRDGEGIQGGLKGFLQGLANAVFKPVAGCTAFVCHPVFGIYKEFCKIKVVVRHEKGSRPRDTPPV